MPVTCDIEVLHQGHRWREVLPNSLDTVKGTVPITISAIGTMPKADSCEAGFLCIDFNKRIAITKISSWCFI